MVKEEHKRELKGKLPQGEWQEEPDFIEYYDEETKYRIRIFRQGLGFLCGYVRVPVTHPWYGRSYNSSIHKDAVPPTEEEVKVQEDKIEKDYPGLSKFIIGNFRITYIHPTEGRTIQEVLDVHGGVTYSGDRDQDFSWEFGFDCGHLGDLVPIHMYGILGEGEYRNIEYVKEQCKKLAEQLKKYE